jgi:pimeloyl-ACP methyl ester carboxylesterase
MKTVPQIDITMLTIPTFIILGHHDQLIPAKLSRQFYKIMPYHTFKTIDQAAHLAMLETPNLVNEDLMHFLQPDYLMMSHSIVDFCTSIK